ncbi:hypothetical protein GBA52_010857 [Prunus armeniaca]|nr:hypothetical protein GBA52_010857 [Prunus armeniaca]
MSLSFSHVYFVMSFIALDNTSSMRCCLMDPLASSSRSSYSKSIMVSSFFSLHAKTMLRPYSLRTYFILLCRSVKFSLSVNGFNSTFTFAIGCCVFLLGINQYPLPT